jgi:hypothetical protein
MALWGPGKKARLPALRFKAFTYRQRLIDSLRASGVATITKTAIESIRINAINLEIRGGRMMWVKRRRLGSGLIALLANLFFLLARAPVHLWIDLKKWQSWEIACFRLLYDRSFCVFPEGRRTVCVDQVRGNSLLDYVERRLLTAREIEAAGRERRRAHGLWCAEFGDYWSHSDPHLDNVIYDEETDQVRLIDFELIHHKSLSALERHADDLIVFLQDLMGRVSAEQWLHFAVALITAYDRPAVTAELRRRLIVPNGCAAIWWKLRTHYLNWSETSERLEALNSALRPSLHRSVRSDLVETSHPLSGLERDE